MTMPTQSGPLDDNHEVFEILSEIEENRLNDNSKIRKLIKNIYDYSKLGEKKTLKKSNALSKLIINNLDDEQIFQQLELQSSEFPKKLAKNQFFISLMSPSAVREEENEEFDSGNENPSSEESEMEMDETENNDFEDLEDEESEEDLDEDNLVSEEHKRKNYRKTVVDDEFFKLGEMEDFLISEEKKIEDEDKTENSEDEEDIDYFVENDDEDMEAITAKFKDYFRAPLDQGKPMNPKDVEDLSELSEEEQGNELSNFKLRQERLKKRIEVIETNAVSEKPWVLKGETKADNRPINSLLEEDLEFDRCTRPAPVVTGKTTLKLEEIILQRITNRAFDDVEKKEIAAEEPFEYKKKLVLNQEKSKESLAQIYEREYLEQKEALNPDSKDKEEEEPELHKEVRKSMDMLIEQLNALYNYHFTPKPAMPELKIVSNIPALQTEEVAPVAFSEGDVLAPQEVMPKTKGDLLGKSERTKTDKKRERRKKKAKQRVHAKLQEKSKKGAILKDANVKKTIQKDDKLRSSKAFFEQIEEREVKRRKLE